MWQEDDEYARLVDVVYVKEAQEGDTMAQALANSTLLLGQECQDVREEKPKKPARCGLLGR
jgi:hypothetical protein